VEDVLLEKPEVRLTKADLAALRQPKRAAAGEPLGRVVVRDGRIVLGEGVMFEGSPERELTDIRLELVEERRLANGYAFEGEAKSALWGRCDIEGTVDLGNRRLDAKFVARGINIDERLGNLLPRKYRKYASAIRRYNLEGVVDLSVEASLDWSGKGAMALRAAAELRDCSAAWERFPVRCTDIRGRVVFDGKNIYYQDITGRAGPATITLNGLTTDEKIEVHLVGRGRPLDRELYEAAPPNLKRVWDRCGIQGGVVNVDYQSTWWRATKTYEASIRSEVRDVRAVYRAFPYPLSDVAGLVRWENGVSYIDSLRGRRGNARVSVRGQVTDAGVPDLSIEALDVPFDETLRKALTPGWQKIFDQLSPQGTAAVQCTVNSPDNDPKKVQYRFVIRPEGASFQHKSFPHRITDVRGDIVVDETGTVTFRGLHGRLGTIPVQFLGSVRPGAAGEQPQLDITVVAPEVELGPGVRRFLSKEWNAVYDELQPRGKVKFTWRLASGPASKTPRQSSEIVCLQDCSVQHKFFPVRVTDLIGRVTMDEAGRTTFTGMKGRLGNAVVEAVAGQCAPGGIGGLNFTVRATGLVLTEEIRRALPSGWQKVWDELRPSGEVALEYQFTGNPKAPDRPSQRVTVEPSNAAFCYTRLPIRVREVTRGKVVFDQDGNATITNVQGKVRDKAVLLAGKVTQGADGGVLQIDVSADELMLDDELKSVLPEEWQKLWDDLRLAGKIGAKASGVIQMREGRWRTFRLDATLRGGEATWKGLPIRLTGLRGRVEYADGAVTLTDVKGECQVAEQVRLAGRLGAKAGGAAARPGPKPGSERGRLQVAVQDLRLEPEFFKAMPEDVRKALGAMKLRGAADAELTVIPSGKAGEPTRFFGVVRLRRCSFTRFQPFEQITGLVRVDRGEVYDDGRQEVRGSLDLRKLVVRKYVVTGIKSAFAYGRKPAGEGKAAASELVLNDLSGSFYGGTLSARMTIGLDGAGCFATWLALRGADFKVFCKDALGADSAATGRLDIRVELPPGRYKGEKGLVGDGTAAVTRGELGQLPLLASVFNALSLRSPLDRSITEANAKFAIARDKLLLKELVLLGESRVLAGQGTAGFDGTLNIRLVSPRAERSILDFVLFVPNLIREQLVQLEVRGTLSQPEVHVLAVPVIPQLVETFTDALGLWRRRHPEKPSSAPKTPEAPPRPEKR